MKIDDLNILVDYHEFWKKEYHDRDINKLPEVAREFVKSSQPILPRHLSKSLFKELFIKSLKDTVKNYSFDENNLKVIDSISEYYTRDNNVKGLMLQGTIGTGKTLLFKALNSVLNSFDSLSCGNYSLRDTSFNIVPSYSFSEAFSIKGYEIFKTGIMMQGRMTHFLHYPLLIDDAGAESICTHFGSTTNVIAEIILRRYDNRAITHITTNLGPTSLKSFYGDRVYSRMREMFEKTLILDGNDRRK